MTKEKIFSGIQPSGTLTIGNYLGALSNFTKQQDAYDCVYCVVDLHALTSFVRPEELRENTLKVLALYLSAGLDPQKSILFVQSHVPAHAELQWILNTVSPLGQLQRMTQYKDKASKHSENLYAGLLNYPILMAGDIILYDAVYVPVGEDQRQHIEFTRDLVEKFNYLYGDTFVMPDILATNVASRVMSLQDPHSKMSKSDADENAFISMLDEPDVITRKIKRAVTDSLGSFAYNEEQAGLRNLIEIYSAFSGDKVEAIADRYKDLGYGKFKGDLAEVVVEGLRPIQQSYYNIMANEDALKMVYEDGARRANEIASKKLKEVYEKTGLLTL